MGRCKKLGSLKSFLRYSSSVSCFPLSWIPSGCTEVGVGRELHCLLATTFFFLQDWQAAFCLGIKKKNHYFIVYTSSEWLWLSSAQSVTQSCPTLCNPMGWTTPGLPVHHQLLEFTQTQVHWVSDAIWPSHPLLSPSSPAFNLSQHQGLFKWVSSSHQVAKVLEFQLQHQSFQWTPSTDLL